jgi:hypothetical protein
VDRPSGNVSGMNEIEAGLFDFDGVGAGTE